MAAQRFSDLVTCLVINLDSRPDRWKRTTRLCRIHGLSPVRFAAHNQERGVERFPDVSVSPGDRGLWSSFLEILDSEHPTEWLLILEDDVIPLPRFRHHVLHYIRHADQDVISIRLGWLGRYRWRPEKSFNKNARKLLGSFRASVRRKTLGGSARVPRKWGTHAILLRSRHLDRVEEGLMPVDAGLDEAFMRAESRQPRAFQVTQRNHAWQWPDRSDIRSS